MKKERSQRLYLLQCFLDNSSLVERSCQSDRRYHPDTVEFMKSLNTYEDLIDGLYEQDVTSKLYSKGCLDVDLWFLLKKCGETSRYLETDAHSIDPEGRTLFVVTLRSLIDLQIARPCDKGIWIKDTSPDLKHCINSDHICWQSAEEYLLSVTSDMEKFMGISEGRIADLVKRIKQDPMFNIPNLLL